MDMVQRIAVKAVIVNNGKILILREAATYSDGTQLGRYHMPGGRIEVGEPFDFGLRREVQEETGLQITIEYPVYVGEWRPTIKSTPNQIVGIFFVCKPTSTGIRLSSEHDDYQWIDPLERRNFDIMDPEDKVIDRYAAWTKKQGPALPND